MIRSLAGRFWGAATRAQNVIEECIEEGTRAAIVSLHALTLDVSEDEIEQIQFQVYLLASSAVTDRGGPSPFTVAASGEAFYSRRRSSGTIFGARRARQSAPSLRGGCFTGRNLNRICTAE